jgi:hypothetical protein
LKYIVVDEKKSMSYIFEEKITKKELRRLLKKSYFINDDGSFRESNLLFESVTNKLKYKNKKVDVKKTRKKVVKKVISEVAYSEVKEDEDETFFDANQKIVGGYSLKFEHDFFISMDDDVYEFFASLVKGYLEKYESSTLQTFWLGVEYSFKINKKGYSHRMKKYIAVQDKNLTDKQLYDTVKDLLADHFTAQQRYDIKKRKYYFVVVLKFI